MSGDRQVKKKKTVTTVTRTNKKFCCHREAARCFVSVNSLVSFSSGVQSCTAIHRVPRRRMGERPLDIEVSCEISGFRPDE